MTEKYWRRAAVGFDLPTEMGGEAAAMILRAVLSELGDGPEDEVETMGVRRVRLPRGSVLEFVHDPAAAISASLLDGDTVTIPVDAAAVAWGPIVELPVMASIGDERPRPLVIVRADGEAAGRIRAAEHRHLAVLADAGFQLLASPSARENDVVTQIQVRAGLD